MRYCIFCGVEIPSDAKYCQICGQEQPGYSADYVAMPADSEQTTPQRKTFLDKMLAQPVKFAIVGGVLFFLVIAALTFGVIFILH